MGLKQRYRRKRYLRGASRRSMLVVAILALFLVLPIIISLYNIQINEHDKLSKETLEQYYLRLTEQPQRGDIFDRNGTVLATTEYTYTVGITPKHTYALYDNSLKKSEIATKIAQILGIDSVKLQKDIEDNQQTYIQLAKEVSQDKIELLRRYLIQNSIGGVKVDPVPKRVYNNEYLGSETLGFASAENGVLVGRLGIEYSFNDVLSGKQGYRYAAYDNISKGGALPYTQTHSQALTNGYNIHTTQDSRIQAILQDALEQAVVTYQAKRFGMGIVMDINNGDILAMASYPYFKSADPSAKPQGYTNKKKWDINNPETLKFLQSDVWRNKVVSDLYEPGSTFKIFTTAMALEDGITDEQRTYSDDPIRIVDRTIKCWSGSGHGVETLQEAFTRSCNPVFVQLAQQLGQQRFYDYVHALGFYDGTGVELPGEAASIFHDMPKPIDLANLSFGEQSTVTVLHQILGVAAAANGGNLLVPHVVHKITDEHGNVIKEYNREVRRKVFSEQTSARVRAMMHQMVLDSDTISPADGYAVGGKTSTATNESNGENTISFVEVAPIDNPRIISLMVLQEPQINKDSSSTIMSATLGMTSKVLSYLNIKPNFTKLDQLKMQLAIPMPNLLGMTLQQAMLETAPQLVTVKDPTGKMSLTDKVGYTVPSVDTGIPRGSTVYVYPNEKAAINDLVEIPDFTGKNYTECLDLAAKAGVLPTFVGDLTKQAVYQEISHMPLAKDAKQQEENEKKNLVPRGTIILIEMGEE